MKKLFEACESREVAITLIIAYIITGIDKVNHEKYFQACIAVVAMLAIAWVFPVTEFVLFKKRRQSHD